MCILVLFLTLGEMLSIFTIEDNVCCGFVIYGFYYVESCSFYICFLRLFKIINGCWILSKAFTASFEMVIWFLIFQFVNMMYHISWFAYIEESLHPWDKINLVWGMIFLICCWILIFRIFWVFLHLCSSVILAYNFLFLGASLSSFGIRVMVAS